MAPGEDRSSLQVHVAYSPGAGRVEERTLTVQAGATLLDALHACGLLALHPEIDLSHQRVGVWGALAPLNAVLRPGDRVEIYRPLQVEPMQARRLRQRKQMKDRERVRADGMRGAAGALPAESLANSEPLEPAGQPSAPARS